jgi:hypothetical protein
LPAAAAGLFSKLLGFGLLLVTLGIRATVLLLVTILLERPVRPVLPGLSLTLGTIALHGAMLCTLAHTTTAATVTLSGHGGTAGHNCGKQCCHNNCSRFHNQRLPLSSIQFNTWLQSE